jgi:hypothetical protein
MHRTIVDFILPLTIAEEGTYNVKIEGKTAKITLALIQNRDVMDRITGMTSIGNVRLMPDPHGIANKTKVNIEFPYAIGDLIKPKPNMLSTSGIKQECIKYLNRLSEVVRYKTKRYWTPFVSGRDIIHINFQILDEQGKGNNGFLSDAGQGFEINLQTQEELSVRTEILGMLEKELKIPSYENLALDSFNYYSMGQFNEAVILMNIALEELVKQFLFEKLMVKLNLPVEKAEKKIDQIFSHKKRGGRTGMHKVMTVDFKEIDGRSLEEYPELWSKFNSVRTTRKNTMHTLQLSHWIRQPTRSKAY